MEQHEVALSGLKGQIAGGSEAGPLAQGVEAAGGDAEDSIVDGEVDLDDAARAASCVNAADGDDLSGEDDAGLRGHGVESVFGCERRGGRGRVGELGASGIGGEECSSGGERDDQRRPSP